VSEELAHLETAGAAPSGASGVFAGEADPVTLAHRLLDLPCTTTARTMRELWRRRELAGRTRSRW
jgi:hypothetical protein